ncbi:MAG: inorganic phosphate transporter, partial [Bacteroidota bacterium]|nr:inorganic phosphate transporter [Bacteroidota bacterium]
MDQIYVIIVAILFIFAIADLVVGVSNDAVNFLVSAVGSKAGKFGVIMIMATLGILIGSVFSNGMMEVARKGIFHPEMFFFEEIIFLFLAVMLTDIILLDFFNTFGFPTSSTVSLVFELLGAAVGISLMKVWGTGENIEDFINTSKALAIIGGILFSVVAAFLLGSIVQWLARIIFTFNIKKSYKKFGGLWAGLAFAIITFFMFVKGLKHSTMNDTYIVQWVLSHRALVILASFVFWTIISQFLIWFTKINVLKVVVLLGTFALAMAFAGNDLVNFIGVPLAGFSSFELWKDSGQLASEFSMEGLSGAVSVNPIFLFIAGAIMIVTLWTSKKAKSVISTSVDLSRQDSGYEKFGSSQLARALVRWAIGISETVKKIIPARTQVFLEKRFRIEEQTGSKKDIPAFDLIRASVNLVVASILISIATSYKLPLSTTYVTFMVTMGTSLSDRAWGRESAVFRVTGVISVITGWFFTAFIAFSMAFIVAILIFKGGAIVIGIIVAVDIFLISKSRIIHKKREKKEKEEKQKYLDEIEFIEKNLFEINTNKILAEIEKILNFLTDVHKAFVSVKRKKLKKALICSEEIKASSKQLKKNIFNTVQHLSDDNLNAAQYYVQVVDALREIANAVNFLAERYYEHIDNNHDVFAKKQLKE